MKFATLTNILSRWTVTLCETVQNRSVGRKIKITRIFHLLAADIISQWLLCKRSPIKSSFSYYSIPRIPILWIKWAIRLLNMPGSKWYLRFVSTRNYTATSMIGGHPVWLADHNNWQRPRKGHTSILLIRQFIKIAFIHADSRDDCFLARRGSIIDAERMLAQTLV